MVNYRRPAGPTVSQTPSISDLEEGLAIDEDALEESCIRQPELFYRVAKELALQTSRRDAANQMVKEAEAKADGQIRHDAQVAEEKITEKEIESQKRLHRDVKSAIEYALLIGENVGQLGALKEAYQQRGYVLKGLIELHVTGYFGDPSNTNTTSRTAISRRNKAELNDARRRERA